MTQAQLIAKAVNEVLAAQGFKAPAAKRSKADMLSAKDRTIKATFTKRGVQGVVLMDRTDPAKEFNVRPYKGWLALGRIVRKGEKSVKGLFHVSQTDELKAAQ